MDLVKIFYDILLNCEKYNDKNLNQKNLFLNKYITLKAHKKGSSRADLSLYFDKYHSFCLDLNANSVLKGEIDFIYI